jgi:hypothetical protein
VVADLEKEEKAYQATINLTNKLLKGKILNL